MTAILALQSAIQGYVDAITAGLPLLLVAALIGVGVLLALRAAFR